ncbi:MAG: hypothetical protein II195_03300, partial [Selenomonadales bacterium]|nr:hypothetical protein [Selenomonadales bacterium]
MTKRLTAMLCALIFSLMSATAFAAEDSFHRDPDVSAVNREKVLAAVREHHFVPNSSARDLVKA